MDATDSDFKLKSPKELQKLISKMERCNFGLDLMRTYNYTLNVTVAPKITLLSSIISDDDYKLIT